MNQNEIGQLATNGLGAIAGVGITFYFLMPFVNKMFNEMTKTQVEIKNSLTQVTENMKQHDVRAEQRSQAMIDELRKLKGEHEESSRVLRQFYEHQVSKNKGGVIA